MIKLLPTILSLLVLVAGALAEPVQGYISAHPMMSLIFGSVYAILTHFLPAPRLGNADVKL